MARTLVITGIVLVPRGRRFILPCGRDRLLHEMSLAREVCRITQGRMGREGCGRVLKVEVEVGDESGVEADNLLFWLEILLAEPPFNGASPIIQRRKGDVLRVSYLEVDDGGPEN